MFAARSLAENSSVAFTQQYIAASQPILSLSAKARTLTRFLVDGVALPGFLKQHGHLLALFTSGAAVGSALYHLFRRYRDNRAKMQLAIFHVVRMIENLPDHQARLYNPHDLIADMDTEVARMIDLHLTRNEAAGVMLQLKRKVWTCVDEQRAVMAKRRKHGTSTEQDAVHERQQELQLRQSEQVEEQYNEVPDSNKAVEAPATPLSSKLEIQELLLLRHEEKEQDVTMMDSDDQGPTLASSSPQRSSDQTTSSAQQSSSFQGRSTYEYPSSSDSDEWPSSPTPAPREPKQVAQSGYNLDYEDDELYSPDSPISSAKISPTEQQHQPPAVVKEPPNMLQAATQRAFDSNAPGNRPYESPILARTPTTKPPSTVKIQQPPNTLATKTRNAKNGTWLVPILEGCSPQDSPPSGITEYRVAESRKLYNEIESERKVRRSIRYFFEQWEDTEQVQQEQTETCAPVVVEEMKVQEWSDPIITYSSSEDDGLVDLGAPLSPLKPIDSPPSVPEISPPLPSPPSGPHTPIASSPALPPPLSSPTFSPVIGVQLRPNTPPPVDCAAVAVSSSPAAKELHTPTPVTTPPRIVVGSSPIVVIRSPPRPATPSPPSKKRGRQRKVVGQVQTLSKAQMSTPGVRTSARKSAYRGKFTN